MDFLYPGDPEPAPGAQLTRTESILVSVAAHLLLLLLLVFLPSILPDGLRGFFLGVPAPPPVAIEPGATDPASMVPDSLAEDEPDAPEASVERLPLEFAYVKLPVDEPVAENENAPLLSDRNRRARQEVPTPEDATRLTIDPHSEGDAVTREIPDPSLPEGIDTVEEGPAPAAGDETVEDGVATASGGESNAPPETPGAEGSPAPPIEIAEAVDDATEGPGPRLPREERSPTSSGDEAPAPDGSQDAAGESGEGAGPGEEGSSRPGVPYEPSDDLRDAIADMRVGESERKFIFSNPGYLRGANYGTMSFDTQDFPWGDYARKLYLIIRENWYSRIPLAAREGIRGYACHRFVIGRDGGIVDMRTVRPSSVPPFNKAALDAIRASDPLPPLPEAFPHDSEGVTFCFFYNMHPAEAR